jgi:hypothetical protein
VRHKQEDRTSSRRRSRRVSPYTFKRSACACVRAWRDVFKGEGAKRAVDPSPGGSC